MRENQEFFVTFSNQELWESLHGELMMKVSKSARLTDETFAYHLIENYWDTWSTTMDLENY